MRIQPLTEMEMGHTMEVARRLNEVIQQLNAVSGQVGVLHVENESLEQLFAEREGMAPTENNGALTPARNVSPGRTIEAELEARGWSHVGLAAIMEIPVEELVELLDYEAPLTEDMADRLARAFGTSVRFWQDLEHNYRSRQEPLDRYQMTGRAVLGLAVEKLPIGQFLYHVGDDLWAVCEGKIKWGRDAVWGLADDPIHALHQAYGSFLEAPEDRFNDEAEDE